MEKRFTALRVVATVFKVWAWITLILGILMAVFVLILGLTLRLPLEMLNVEQGAALFGLGGFIAVMLGALIGYLAFYALGDLLYLFMSIEENTRVSAYLAQQQYVTAQSTAPEAPVDNDLS